MRLVGGIPESRGDRARQVLLLAPGVAFLTTGVLNLFPDFPAMAWILVVIGLVLVLAFTRARLRSRGRPHPAVPRAGDPVR